MAWTECRLCGAVDYDMDAEGFCVDMRECAARSEARHKAVAVRQQTELAARQAQAAAQLATIDSQIAVAQTAEDFKMLLQGIKGVAELYKAHADMERELIELSIRLMMVERSIAKSNTSMGHGDQSRFTSPHVPQGDMEENAYDRRFLSKLRAAHIEILDSVFEQHCAKARAEGYQLTRAMFTTASKKIKAEAAARARREVEERKRREEEEKRAREVAELQSADTMRQGATFTEAQDQMHAEVAAVVDAEDVDGVDADQSDVWEDGADPEPEPTQLERLQAQCDALTRENAVMRATLDASENPAAWHQVQKQLNGIQNHMAQVTARNNELIARVDEKDAEIVRLRALLDAYGIQWKTKGD